MWTEPSTRRRTRRWIEHRVGPSTESLVQRRSRFYGALLLVVALSGLWDCAAFNKRNTPLVATIEEQLVPESTAARVATFPLILPLGILAGVLDVFIIHPLLVLPDAARDTVEWLWVPNEKSGYVTIVGSVPFKLVATPVVFALDWLARSAFDIGPRRDGVQTKPPLPKPGFGALIEAGRVDAAVTHLRKTIASALDESASVREHYRRLPDRRQRDVALHYLSDPKRFANNEGFLARQVAWELSRPADRSAAGSLLSRLHGRFQETRGPSRAGSLALLVALQNRQVHESNLALAVQSLFQFGFSDHVAALRDALGTIRLPPKQ